MEMRWVMKSSLFKETDRDRGFSSLERKWMVSEVEEGEVEY